MIGLAAGALTEYAAARNWYSKVYSPGDQPVAGTYVVLGTVPTPFATDFLDVYLQVGAGTYTATQSGATTVVWDNINVP